MIAKYRVVHDSITALWRLWNERYKIFRHDFAYDEVDIIKKKLKEFAVEQGEFLLPTLDFEVSFWGARVRGYIAKEITSRGEDTGNRIIHLVDYYNVYAFRGRVSGVEEQGYIISKTIPILGDAVFIGNPIILNPKNSSYNRRSADEFKKQQQNLESQTRNLQKLDVTVRESINEDL